MQGGSGVRVGSRLLRAPEGSAYVYIGDHAITVLEAEEPTERDAGFVEAVLEGYGIRCLPAPWLLVDPPLDGWRRYDVPRQDHVNE